MKKRLILSIGALLAVTVSAAAYYRANASADVPRYVTAAISRSDVIETVEATGTLRAVTTVQVGSQVSGTIESLHADFNSRVKKGQVIARLDPALLQAQVDQAEATIARLQADVERAGVALDDAQVKLRRARELSTQGLIPRADLDAAESTAKQAEAELKGAQAQVVQARSSLNQNRVNLSHTIITAPVDGIVISRNVELGQTVAASLSAPTLFVIAKDLTEMQVEASVDEADIGRIQPGQHVTFRVDAYPQDTFSGRVAQVRLEPVVVQNVVSYVTVIDVPNPQGKLKPGMTATVTVEVARADNALTVPNAALKFQPPFAKPTGTARGGTTSDRTSAPDRGRVWTLRDGQLEPVRVRTGVTNGTATAILDDTIAEGTTVITGITASSDTPATTTSPLIPQRARRNRQAGNGLGRGGA